MLDFLRRFFPHRSKKMPENLTARQQQEYLWRRLADANHRHTLCDSVESFVFRFNVSVTVRPVWVDDGDQLEFKTGDVLWKVHTGCGHYFYSLGEKTEYKDWNCLHLKGRSFQKDVIDTMLETDFIADKTPRLYSFPLRFNAKPDAKSSSANPN